MKSYFKLCLIFLFVITITPVTAQWQGMSVNQIMPTQSGVYSLAIGTTNKDDYADLLVLPTNTYDLVHIYNGSANHEFTFSSSVSKEETFRNLKTGDLNADGIDDLVISSYWSNGFNIFWGSENGDYIQGEYYGLTGHGRNLELTDINTDGSMDIVALSGGSGQPITLHLFFGNKTKKFITGGVYPSQVDTDTRITIVDKDQNGLPDVMVSSSFPWFVIFYQEPVGTFVPRYWPHNIEFPFTSSYYLADLNNDERQDIIANYSEEGFRFYAGGPDTLFNEQYISYKLNINPYRIYTIDLNRDGFIDILMDSYSSEYEPTDTLFYLLGNGDFTFEELKPIVFPAKVSHYTVGDFNKDDFPDIVAYCTNLGIVTALNEGILTEIEEDNTFVLLSPNPFTDQLEVKPANQSTMVHIFDSRGMLLHGAAIQNNQTINTTSWQNGLYIACIMSGKKLFFQKVIKR